MVKKNFLKRWREKEEPTRPEHMEPCLRAVALMTLDDWGTAGAFFPWYRPIENQLFFLHFRKEERRKREMFSLDLGSYGEHREGWKRFYSHAWLDCDLGEVKTSDGVVRVGFVGIEMNPQIEVFRLPHVVRPGFESRDPLRGRWALYIEPDLRRNKVGTAMIDAARIVLDQLGGEKIRLHDIPEFEEGGLRRTFYQSLGMKITGEHYWEGRRTGERVLYGYGEILTRATEEIPYRFR